MPQPFSLLQSRCAEPDTALLDELFTHTGSRQAAAGILRSIERFGADPTIFRYDISPKTHGRGRRNSTATAWSVRAVRTKLPR